MNEEKFASVLRPWEKYYDPEMIKKPLEGMLMYSALKKSCRGKEENIALDYYGTEISYGKLIDNIDKYAASFSEMGISKGDKVSFITVSIPESIYAIYGLNKIGAVCNFIDIRTDSSHIIEYILKARSKAIVMLDFAWDKVKDAVERLNVDKIVIQRPDESFSLLKKLGYKIKVKKKNIIDFSNSKLIRNIDFEKLGEGKSVDEVPYEKDMPAIVTRTGGTTGKSKGVVLTNDSMNAVYRNFRDVVGDTTGDTFLNFLPIAASYGIVCGIHMALCMTIRDILLPIFSPDEFSDLVLKYKPNHIIGVPVFYEDMMNSTKMQNEDLSFIKTMAAGGDTASLGFEEKLREFTKERGVKYPLAQGYGMSETSSACSYGIRDIHKNGSAGIPCIHSNISIFEPGTDKELPLGTTGEICISGPTVMKEYLDEKEETENIIKVHSDGERWVHSGDLGHIDEDGFLFITGRIKRSIIRFDGHKAYPVQIEEVVERSKDVKSCAVIGIRDRSHEKGELPLVILDKADDSELSDEKLKKENMDLCEKNLEGRGRPIDVVIVNEIPHTNNNKKDIQALESMFKDYDYLKKKVN